MHNTGLAFTTSFAVLFTGAAILVGQSTPRCSDVTVQHLEAIKADQQPWGTLQWMMNSQIGPGAGQTFGIAEIRPGQRNPRHFHPNCEELLYVISGSCEHIVGATKVTLKPGDLIRIPRGVLHQAVVLGNEPLRVRSFLRFAQPPDGCAGALTATVMHAASIEGSSGGSVWQAGAALEPVCYGFGSS